MVTQAPPEAGCTKEANTAAQTPPEVGTPEKATSQDPVTPEKPTGIEGANLEPDDLNFPRLPTPAKTPENLNTPPEPSQKSLEKPHFVWGPKTTVSDSEGQATTSEQPRVGGEKGKGKAAKPPDSTPITRQGYRSGRLADDFWLALNVPNTPNSQRKTLRVIPILVRDRKEEQMEYLTNSKTTTSKAIAQVHIAEQLAGIPWTETRAQQHVVNEVAQALYKVLVFPNPTSNPLQRWKQGRWYANWERELDGGYTCTLYVSVLVQEPKFKPRRGQSHNWSKIPGEIGHHLQLHKSDMVETIMENQIQWHTLIHNAESSSNNPPTEVTATLQNRFAALSDEEALTR